MLIGPTRKAASLDRAAGELAGVGAIGLEQAVLDDDRQAEGHQQDRQDALADGALQQETLQDVADAERDRDQDQRDEKRRPAERAVSDRMTNENSTMMSPWAMLTKRITPSESDRPSGEQRVEAAEQHALDNEVDERLDHFAHDPK